MLSAVLLMGFFALVAVCEFLGFQEARAGSPYVFVLAGAPTVLVALFAVERLRRQGELFDWLRPVWGDFSRGFLGAGALFGLSWAAARLLSGTPREIWLARLYLQIGSLESLRVHMGWVAFAIVVISAAEEIVWRGMVTSLLEPRFGSRRAWIVSALLYAAAGLPTLWALGGGGAGLNPILVIAALAGGLLWGGMTRKFGRLTPAVLSHALFTWCVVMMFRLWGSSF